jgi:hypothetical protein
VIEAGQTFTAVGVLVWMIGLRRSASSGIGARGDQSRYGPDGWATIPVRKAPASIAIPFRVG